MPAATHAQPFAGCSLIVAKQYCMLDTGQAATQSLGKERSRPALVTFAAIKFIQQCRNNISNKRAGLVSKAATAEISPVRDATECVFRPCTVVWCAALLVHKPSKIPCGKVVSSPLTPLGCGSHIAEHRSGYALVKPVKNSAGGMGNFEMESRERPREPSGLGIRSVNN